MMRATLPADRPTDTLPASLPTDTLPAEVDVAIVGGGFAGLGMAVKLLREGHEGFVILERGEEVGGTWWVNTYPGCGCDVPSHLYSFSFAPNPDWTRTYSKQGEIEAYLKRVAEDFGVTTHVRAGTTVTGAEWDDDARRWTLETSRGSLQARVLISAAGALSDPKLPDIPGLERFRGHTFHSAQWDHDYDVAGKRIGAIGTGASAIQFVPAIASSVTQLHVFQRTAPWIMPHSDRPITRLERRLYRRFPALQRLVRGGVYAGRELFVLGFVKDPRLMRLAEKIARTHMKRQVPDAELRAKVTPDYTIGCKRILPSNDWYPALGRENVELVADGIAEVREHSIVTADGTEREVDAIVFGTGFNVVDMPVARHVRGRGGATLDDRWQGSPRAYLGTAVAGFPNFFMLLGPNTGLGHSSMVYMIESQVAYVAGALRTMRAEDAEVAEVRPETVEAYNRELDRRMERTVWTTGCSSWYLDDTGRNATLWPDWTFRFRQRTRRFEPAEYELHAARPERRTSRPESFPTRHDRSASVRA
jgi:cation diffusion facilitator CzcD-associated flavoprotein CzcO